MGIPVSKAREAYVHNGALFAKTLTTVESQMHGPRGDSLGSDRGEFLNLLDDPIQTTTFGASAGDTVGAKSMLEHNAWQKLLETPSGHAFPMS